MSDILKKIKEKEKKCKTKIGPLLLRLICLMLLGDNCHHTYLTFCQFLKLDTPRWNTSLASLPNKYANFLQKWSSSQSVLRNPSVREYSKHDQTKRFCSKSENT